MVYKGRTCRFVERARPLVLLAVLVHQLLRRALPFFDRQSARRHFSS